MKISMNWYNTKHNLPEAPKRRDEEQTVTKQISHMKLPTHEHGTASEEPTAMEMQRNRGTNRHEMVSRNTARMGGAKTRTKRKIALNSVAAPNYKYIFGPHRRPLTHQWNITVKYIQSQVLGWWGNKTKGSMARLRTLIVMRQSSETDWGGKPSFSLSTD